MMSSVAYGAGGSPHRTQNFQPSSASDVDQRIRGLSARVTRDPRIIPSIGAALGAGLTSIAFSPLAAPIGVGLGIYGGIAIQHHLTPSSSSIDTFADATVGAASHARAAAAADTFAAATASTASHARAAASSSLPRSVSAARQASAAAAPAAAMALPFRARL